jgi:ribosomal protein S18 acetylase RimI-like enzyme
MLGVDPDFGGKGIASELVRHGAEQAGRAKLPAYTESTPAAVRVYAKQGFKPLGRKDVLEDGSYYFTAMLKMPDDSATLS